MRILELFRRRLVVARFGSIPIRIDYGWLLVWALMSFLTAVNVPESIIEGFAGRLLLGIVAMLVFFFTVVIHELAHALVARWEGIGVEDIYLHPFGGVARLKSEPETPLAEFRIAMAGPAASFLTSIVFFFLWAVSSYLGATVLSPALFLVFLLNLLLAIFNLFPGYPLDGGRILRALLWSRGTGFYEATLLSGKFGQIIAGALVFFGLGLAFLKLDLFTGLWTSLVGLFLFDSATSIVRRINSGEHLTAVDLMTAPFAVDPETSLMDLVDKVLPIESRAVFAVARDGRLRGFFLLLDLKRRELPRSEWRRTTVADVMRPLEPDDSVSPETPFGMIKSRMRSNGIGVLGVVDHKGLLLGLIDLGSIQR